MKTVKSRMKLSQQEAGHGGECDRLVPYLFWKCISNPWSHKKQEKLFSTVPRSIVRAVGTWIGPAE